MIEVVKKRYFNADTGEFETVSGKPIVRCDNCGRVNENPVFAYFVLIDKMSREKPTRKTACCYDCGMDIIDRNRAMLGHNINRILLDLHYLEQDDKGISVGESMAGYTSVTVERDDPEKTLLSKIECFSRKLGLAISEYERNFGKRLEEDDNE